MRGPLSQLVEDYNYLEIGIWCAIGAVVAFRGLFQTGQARRNALIAAVVLVAFGLSDYAEIRSGGEWWHPRWLLLWKAACVAGLLGLLVMARIRQRRMRCSEC